MTSKEAGQILGISPYTVDQRITAVRQKLGAVSRKELIQMFAAQPNLSQRTAYDEPCVPKPAENDHQSAIDEFVQAHFNDVIRGSAKIDPPLMVRPRRRFIEEAISNSSRRDDRRTEAKVFDAVTTFQMAAFMLLLFAQGIMVFS
jgi:hypothetical protein